jgi:quinol monooxygenase YgiN
MIARLVTMTFKQEAVDDFKRLFESQKDKIRNQPGCLMLELHQDIARPEVFMTYSHWTTEEALNEYRHSALFEEVWPATKQLFADKPRAVSLNRLHHLP